jgi:hypothetical protein
VPWPPTVTASLSSRRTDRIATLAKELDNGSIAIEADVHGPSGDRRRGGARTAGARGRRCPRQQRRCHRWSESHRRELLPDVRVTLIEPGAVATELPNHITHAEARQGTEQLYSQVEVTAEDIAEVIAFVVSRPRRLAIHEVLLRPAGQEL